MPGDFWNMRQMHQNLGFARSYFRDEFMDGESFGMGLTDEVFFEQIEAHLHAAREPFLAFLITLSNHLPYELPPRHRHLDLGDLDGTTVGRYLNSVHYFDRAFGALIDRLNASGLLDRSLVVVYGDHRAFWEKTPEVPKLLGFSPDDRFRLWKAERRLPLLIRLPTQEGAREVQEPASHVDIAPTVLSLLGVPAANEVMLGRDLLSDDPPLVVFRDGSFIAGDRAAIASGSDSLPECAELRSGAQVPCGPLEQARREATRHKEVSDLLIRGNLIRVLRRPAKAAISPSAALRPVQIICHRGNLAEAPENTLASIEAAFSLGCDVVEIDVRLSRDGVAVIIHDETVDRTTNGSGNVADLTVAELKALDAAHGGGAGFPVSAFRPWKKRFSPPAARARFYSTCRYLEWAP